MPRSRFDGLVTLTEENDGLLTAEQARAAGFTDSVLARLVQRERIEQIARGSGSGLNIAGAGVLIEAYGYRQSL